MHWLLDNQNLRLWELCSCSIQFPKIDKVLKPAMKPFYNRSFISKFIRFLCSSLSKKVLDMTAQASEARSLSSTTETFVLSQQNSDPTFPSCLPLQPWGRGSGKPALLRNLTKVKFGICECRTGCSPSRNGPFYNQNYKWYWSQIWCFSDILQFKQIVLG